MKKRVAVGGLCALLSGCGMTYFLEGAKYDSRDSFVAARDAMNSRCTASVIPLVAPVVKRKLVFLIPTQSAVYQNRFSIVKAAIPNDPITIDGMKKNPIISGVGENYRLDFERIKRRNIYMSVDVSEYDTLSLPQASSEVDVLYVAMPEVLGGRDTFYLVTQKGGKQLVNISGAVPKCEAIRDSLLESIQTIALQ